MATSGDFHMAIDSPSLTQRSLGFLMVNRTPKEPPAPLELARSA